MTTEARTNDTTIGLARGVLDDAAHLVQTEVKLAKAELSANLLALVRPLALIVAGMLLGVGALFTLLGAFVGLLAPYVGAFLAALIVAVVTAAIAGLLVASGAGALGKAGVAPKRTQRSVERDIAMVKGQGI